jgi:hypothetical protein
MLALLNGCAHTHMVHNVTDKSVYNVTVYSGERSFGHGILISKSDKAYCGDIKFRKSDPPEVEWTTSAGETKREKVFLEKNPGTFYQTHFVISDKGVTAYLLPEEHTADEWFDFLVKIGECNPKSSFEAK